MEDKCDVMGGEGVKHNDVIFCKNSLDKPPLNVEALCLSRGVELAPGNASRRRCFFLGTTIITCIYMYYNYTRRQTCCWHRIIGPS